MDKVMEKWNEILQMIKEEHGLTDVSFNTWIKPLEVFAIDGNTPVSYTHLDVYKRQMYRLAQPL